MGLMDSLKGIARAKPGTVPLDKKELKRKLLALNHEQLPFKVGEGGEIDVVAEWKIADAAWYEIFAKAGLKMAHRILLALHEAERTVRVLEESYSVQWRAGVPSVSLKAEKFQGRTIGSKKLGAGYAFKGVDPLSFGKVYRYRFDVSEMKEPLKETVTGAGWDFVPVMTRNKLLR